MKAKLLLPVDRLIIRGERSGLRYEFTRLQRVLTIADEDVEQFETREVERSKCGCTGGNRHNEKVRVFRILN